MEEMNNQQEKHELTDEQLEAISAGAYDVHLGEIACPLCRAKIPISMRGLLVDGAVICSACGMTMKLSKEKSAKALEAFRKVERMQEAHQGM